MRHLILSYCNECCGRIQITSSGQKHEFPQLGEPFMALLKLRDALPVTCK